MTMSMSISPSESLLTRSITSTITRKIRLMSNDSLSHINSMGRVLTVILLLIVNLILILSL